MLSKQLKNSQDIQDTNTCGNCKYFRLHYTKSDNRHYTSLHYGHCITPRLKDRKEKEKACQYWQERTDT